jgi:hypothetical protein
MSAMRLQCDFLPIEPERDEPWTETQYLGRVEAGWPARSARCPPIYSCVKVNGVREQMSEVGEGWKARGAMSLTQIRRR